MITFSEVVPPTPAELRAEARRRHRMALDCARLTRVYNVQNAPRLWHARYLERAAQARAVYANAGRIAGAL